jgi:hypothetical protein
LLDETKAISMPEKKAENRRLMRMMSTVAGSSSIALGMLIKYTEKSGRRQRQEAVIKC